MADFIVASITKVANNFSTLTCDNNNNNEMFQILQWIIVSGESSSVWSSSNKVQLDLVLRDVALKGIACERTNCVSLNGTVAQINSAMAQQNVLLSLFFVSRLTDFLPSTTNAAAAAAATLCSGEVSDLIVASIAKVANFSTVTCDDHNQMVQMLHWFLYEGELSWPPTNQAQLQILMHNASRNVDKCTSAAADASSSSGAAAAAASAGSSSGAVAALSSSSSSTGSFSSSSSTLSAAPVDSITASSTGGPSSGGAQSSTAMASAAVSLTAATASAMSGLVLAASILVACQLANMQ
jgi:hypothetical protein